jgi:hypothetical protein
VQFKLVKLEQSLQTPSGNSGLSISQNCPLCPEQLQAASRASAVLPALLQPPQRPNPVPSALVSEPQVPSQVKGAQQSLADWPIVQQQSQVAEVATTHLSLTPVGLLPAGLSAQAALPAQSSLDTQRPELPINSQLKSAEHDEQLELKSTHLLFPAIVQPVGQEELTLISQCLSELQVAVVS